MFASYISDKGLITRIYSTKINEPIKKANGTKWSFFKGRNANGQNTHDICSPSLAIKEMQIKLILRFHLTLVRITTIKNTNNKC
jgi:hypothetical protein